MKNILKLCSPSSRLLYEHLFSRRNNVFLIKSCDNKTTPFILKFYSEPHSILKRNIEYENLIKFNREGLNVPQVQKNNSNYNILEYIPGVLVSDLAYSLNKGEWIKKLAYWMFKLHSIKLNSDKDSNKKSYLKGDCNLRNFIYYKNQIYGLDFEEKSFGDPLQDLSEICVFILDNQMNNPDKIFIVQKFLKEYEKVSSNEIDNLANFLRKSIINSQKRKNKYRKNLKKI